jgi:hypothetical protein
MKECDHESLSTPFCPLCGKRVFRSHLETLLDHINIHLKELSRDSGRIDRRLAEDHTDPIRYGYEKKKASCLSLITKWENWKKAVEEAIDLRNKYEAG